MNSVQERLKLKMVPIDTWSIKEKLCLASAVLRSGDQNWMSVSRALRLFGEPGRPTDWFSQKSCALQYGNLLENVDTPKRKKRTDKSGSEHVETPGEAIVRNLTQDRVAELKRLLQEERNTYLLLKEEVAQIKAGQVDDRLGELCQQMEEEDKQKERVTEAHKRWLQERQEKMESMMRTWKPPVTSVSPQRNRKVPRGPGYNRRNSSQSEPSSEADSPLNEPLNVDVIGDESSEVSAEVKPVAPTPTSPLLTSLLKSPSPAPNSQSSILHSAITSTHHRAAVNNPTIASLLHSSPGIPTSGVASVAPPPAMVSSSLKNLVTSAIGTAGSDETPKPPSTSPSAGAPTLSMLLELPPSLPGKPLPELPVSSVAKPTLQHLSPSTSKQGEVCHPQHQEMHVRRELGTDEHIEVVEVEHHPNTITIPNLQDHAALEVIVGTQELSTMGPPLPPALHSQISQDLEDVAEVIANVTKMEEEAAERNRAQAIAESLEGKKETEEMANEIKMLMDMPIVMDNSVPEPQTIAEVIEVPTQSNNDLDIIIVDGSALGGQEEVAPDTECQVVEVVVNDKNVDSTIKQESSEEVSRTTEETVAVVVDEKQETSKEVESALIQTMPEIKDEISVEVKDMLPDEESRIEVVAIEIPDTKSEVRETPERDLKEEHEIEKDVDSKFETLKDEQKETLANISLPEKAAKNVTPSKKKDADSKGQMLDNIESKPEKSTNEVRRTPKKETALEHKLEQIVKEIETLNEFSEKQDNQSSSSLDSVSTTKQSKENLKKDGRKKVEEKITTVSEENSAQEEATEKVDEIVEEEDSLAESSEDEKKPWKIQERSEEVIIERHSTGGKTWKEEDLLAEEDDDKKDKIDEVKQHTDKSITAQKGPIRAETPSTEDDKTNDAVEPPRSNRRRGITVTSMDSVPNSPAAPITDEDREYRAWKKAIMLVYGRLATHKYASLFLRPITDDQAPGYSSVVHRPIDLCMIKKNIETGVTRTTAEFQRDVMLMFLNSIMYNKSSHFVHKMARQMQQECMQHIQDFLTTQMLVQVVGEAPLRRETRTTEANKQRDFLNTGTASQDEAEAAGVPTNKRKRSEQDRSYSKKRKVAGDE